MTIRSSPSWCNSFIAADPDLSGIIKPELRKCSKELLLVRFVQMEKLIFSYKDIKAASIINVILSILISMSDLEKLSSGFKLLDIAKATINTSILPRAIQFSFGKVTINSKINSNIWCNIAIRVYSIKNNRCWNSLIRIVKVFFKEISSRARRQN